VANSSKSRLAPAGKYALIVFLGVLAGDFLVDLLRGVPVQWALTLGTALGCAAIMFAVVWLLAKRVG